MAVCPDLTPPDTFLQVGIGQQLTEIIEYSQLSLRASEQFSSSNNQANTLKKII